MRVGAGAHSSQFPLHSKRTSGPAVTTKTKNPLRMNLEIEEPPGRVASSASAPRKTTPSRSMKSFRWRSYYFLKSQITDMFAYLNATRGMGMYFNFRAGYLEPVVIHPVFGGFVFFCIFANTIVLALEEPFDSEIKTAALLQANQVFTFIFALEMVMKLAALGPHRYLSSRWNVFDMLIVTISVPECLPMKSFSELGNASALRALRVFRVLKAANKLTAVQNISKSNIQPSGSNRPSEPNPSPT